jgi:hypothetical protein
MPFYRITPHALLIEAVDATSAAMLAYRRLDDRTPTVFDVVGPDAELRQIVLSPEHQDEAITIAFTAKENARSEKA